jgi:hypothetical protein
MAEAGATVVCVDTWEGSANDAGCKAYDGSRGEPFQVFLENIRGLPIRAHIDSSPGAAGEFKDGEFDIVYIDAEPGSPRRSTGSPGMTTPHSQA